MRNIKHYNVYLNEHQERKLQLLALTSGKDPEEIINEAIYRYLLIADPLAADSCEEKSI